MLFRSSRLFSTKIEASAIASYPDKTSLWWKSSKVDAWLMGNSGVPSGLLTLEKSVFASTPVRNDLIKRAIVYEQSWREQGTESTKNLGQVRGSTRKPFAQKGRGKARVGTLRAPNFRGGYRVHGPRPHIKTIDIQRKVYDSAIRAALSAKFLQSQLIVVESLTMKDDKKSTLKDFLALLNLDGRKCYLIYGNEEPEKQLIRASNNFGIKLPSEEFPNGERPILVSSARNVIVGPLMEFEMVILDKAAVEVLEEKYKLDL